MKEFIVWFHLCSLFKDTDLRQWRRDQWLQGVSLGTNGKIASINNGDTSWKNIIRLWYNTHIIVCLYYGGYNVTK